MGEVVELEKAGYYGVRTTPLFWVNYAGFGLRLSQARVLKVLLNRKDPTLSVVMLEFSPYILTFHMPNPIVRAATWPAVKDRRWGVLGFSPANEAAESMLQRTVGKAAGMKYVESTFLTLGAQQPHKVLKP